VQEVVVGEDEMAGGVKGVDVVRSPRARAGMLGRVNGESPGQLIEEPIPRETPRPVKEDQGWPMALRQDPQADLVLPDRDAPRARRHRVRASDGDPGRG